MLETMERSAVVLSFVAAFGVAIWYSAPVWVAPAPAHEAHGACRLRLTGALEGIHPCTVEQERRARRLTLLVATEPRAGVEVRFRAELEPAGDARDMAQAKGTTLQALVLERRSGAGAVWLGPDGLEVRAPPDGGPVRLRMLVPAAPENPDRRPVEVEADVPLPRLAAAPGGR